MEARPRHGWGAGLPCPHCVHTKTHPESPAQKRGNLGILIAHCRSSRFRGISSMAKAIKHAALYVRVSAGPLLSSLGAADSRIAVDLRNVPAAVFGDLRELAVWFSTDWWSVG
jgi:hypothetical protein